MAFKTRLNFNLEANKITKIHNQWEFIWMIELKCKNVKFRDFNIFILAGINKATILIARQNAELWMTSHRFALLQQWSTGRFLWEWVPKRGGKWGPQVDLTLFCYLLFHTKGANPRTLQKKAKQIMRALWLSPLFAQWPLCAPWIRFILQESLFARLFFLGSLFL